MKLLSAFVPSLLMFAFTSLVFGEPSQAELTKQAKVSKTEAEHIALARVPHGSIKSAEIENERNHLVWSFDISTHGTRNITEILVDAKSGKIISQQSETSQEQANEAAAEKRLKQ
jgi:Zn-dependent metalloprotease